MIRTVVAFVVGLIVAIFLYMSGVVQRVFDPTFWYGGQPTLQAPVVETPQPVVTTAATSPYPNAPTGAVAESYPGAGEPNAAAPYGQQQNGAPYASDARSDRRFDDAKLRLVVNADPNMPPNARRCGLYAFANRTAEPVLLYSDGSVGRRDRGDGVPDDAVVVQPGETKAQQCGPVYPPPYVGVPPGYRRPSYGEPQQTPIVTIELHAVDSAGR